MSGRESFAVRSKIFPTDLWIIEKHFPVHCKALTVFNYSWREWNLLKALPEFSGKFFNLGKFASSHFECTAREFSGMLQLAKCGIDKKPLTLKTTFFVSGSASVGVFSVPCFTICACREEHPKPKHEEWKWAKRSLSHHATPQISPLNIEFPWKGILRWCWWSGISAFYVAGWGTSQTVARLTSPKFFLLFWTCIFR